MPPPKASFIPPGTGDCPDAQSGTSSIDCVIQPSVWAIDPRPLPVAQAASDHHHVSDVDHRLSTFSQHISSLNTEYDTSLFSSPRSSIIGSDPQAPAKPDSNLETQSRGTGIQLELQPEPPGDSDLPPVNGTGRYKEVQRQSFGSHNVDPAVSLDDARQSIMEDGGYDIPQATYDFFKRSLPRVAGLDDERMATVSKNIQKQLIKENIIIPVNNTLTSSTNSGSSKEDHDVSPVDGNPPMENALAGHRWAAFPSDMRELPEHEPRAYARLVPIYNRIIEIAKSMPEFSALEQNLKMDYSPKSAPISEKPNTAIPDSFLIKIKSTVLGTDLKPRFPSRRNWVDIPLVIEIKKGEDPKNRLENLRQILHHGTFLLHEDIRRRASWGLQFENRNLRIFFFSRGGIVCSDSIDWVSEQDKFIEIFLRFTFASDSALGYDSTITRFCDSDGETQYKFKVEEKTFVTVGPPLADYRSTRAKGRATRVYAVYDEEDPTRQPRALKDLWIPLEAEWEGHFMESLREKAEQARVAEYFLTPLCHGAVLVPNHENTAVKIHDTTKELFRCDIMEAQQFYSWRDNEDQSNKRRKFEIPGFRRSNSGQNHTTSKAHKDGLNVSGVSGFDPRSDHKDCSRHFSHRLHYRIVFKEACKQIDTLPSIYHFFFMLKKTVGALEALHKLNYVHRDISIGNILYAKTAFDLQAKLTDLEYKREIDDCSEENDILTGTLQYIAVEVALNRYIFWKENAATLASRGQTIDPDADTDIAWEMLAAENEDETKRILKENREKLLEEKKKVELSKPELKDHLNSPGHERPFKYNTYHDLESLWWVAEWFLFFHIPEYEAKSTKFIPHEKVDLQLTVASQIFTEHMMMAKLPTLREPFLTKDTVYKDCCSNLPLEFKPAYDYLLILRQSLERAYYATERLPRLRQAHSKLYSTFVNAFDHILDIYKDNYVPVIRASYSEGALKSILRHLTDPEVPKTGSNNSRKRSSPLP